MKFNKNEFGWKEKVSINTDELVTKEYVDENTQLCWLEDYEATGSKLQYADVNVSSLTSRVFYAFNFKKHPGVTTVRLLKSYDDGTIKSIINLGSTLEYMYLMKISSSIMRFYLKYATGIVSECVCTFGNTSDECTFKRTPMVLYAKNTYEYTPTTDYNPATKKYVDDKFIAFDLMETVGTIPQSELQKCNNGTSRYVSSIDFDTLFSEPNNYMYYATYKDDTLIPIEYQSNFNRMVTNELDSADGEGVFIGFDYGTHMMYPFNGGMASIKAYTFVNDLIIKRCPLINANEVATKKYVDDSVNTVSENNIFKNTQMNNMLSSLTIGGSLSTGLTKSKTLGEVFPKLLNGEYGVLKQCYVTVEVDGTTKPILTESYNNVLIQLYDNDNNLISSTSLRPKKVGTIYFNANEFMQMAVWFDATYTEGSGLSHNTPGYVTSLLNISASKNTEEYINAIKDLRISVTLRHTNYLPKDNTVVYEPTSDYNPATKKYVDDSIANQPTFSFNDSGELVVTINGVTKTFVPKQ